MTRTCAAVVCVLAIGWGGVAFVQRSAAVQDPDLSKCEGKSPCKACRNCSNCAHCNSGGGTCGVCKKVEEACCD